mmetsp:Transcript_8942/g.19747  ORF Transcript_8942/g.19747 Transcript_8942/m.19747 type:complete len:576 (-) Transcript_8942:69-1796(-)
MTTLLCHTSRRLLLTKRPRSQLINHIRVPLEERYDLGSAKCLPGIGIRTVSSAASKADAETRAVHVAVIGDGYSALSTALHILSRNSSKTPYRVTLHRPPSSDDDGRNGVRDRIGVGIWSNKALVPFLRSGMEDLVRRLEHGNRGGVYCREVGYQIPSGRWLVRSQLQHAPLTTSTSESISMHRPGILDPRLLFLQSDHLLEALELEMEKYISNGSMTVVTGKNKIDLPQLLKKGSEDDDDYDLVVVADGRNSHIRKQLLERHSEREGTTEKKKGRLLDRGYTVFRANVFEYARNEPPNDEATSAATAASFQTWGTERSMRFAAVPLPRFGGGNGDADATALSRHSTVWFATTDDPSLATEPCPERRKERLLRSFKTWHDPIPALITSTAADQIVADGAEGHARSDRDILLQEGVLRGDGDGNGGGDGVFPPLCFVGDADETMDPVLAQGITIGMEDAEEVAACLSRACEKVCRGGGDSDAPSLWRLRSELQGQLERRHRRKTRRLASLHNTTSLVQSLAQPGSGGSMGERMLSAASPLVRHVVIMLPNILVRSVFDAVSKYSLSPPASLSEEMK